MHRKCELELIDETIAELEEALKLVKDARSKVESEKLPYVRLTSGWTFKTVRKAIDYLRGPLHIEMMKSIRDFKRSGGSLPVEPERAKYDNPNSRRATVGELLAGVSDEDLLEVEAPVKKTAKKVKR